MSHHDSPKYSIKINYIGIFSSKIISSGENNLFELVTIDLLALHKPEFVLVHFVSCRFSLCIHRTSTDGLKKEFITNDSKRITLEMLWIQLQRL